MQTEKKNGFNEEIKRYQKIIEDHFKDSTKNKKALEIEIGAYEPSKAINEEIILRRSLLEKISNQMGYLIHLEGNLEERKYKIIVQRRI
ncbi:MAG: hypothetical protein QXJ28_00880 [Candidatus Pacearchaeota archaeon]